MKKMEVENLMTHSLSGPCNNLGFKVFRIYFLEKLCSSYKILFFNSLSKKDEKKVVEENIKDLEKEIKDIEYSIEQRR